MELNRTRKIIKRLYWLQSINTCHDELCSICILEIECVKVNKLTTNYVQTACQALHIATKILSYPTYSISILEFITSFVRQHI